MNRKPYYAVLAIALLVLFAVAYADDDSDIGSDALGPYKYLKTISVPGNLAAGFDISWVNSESGRYYLADRGDAVPAGKPPSNPKIDVIDAETDSFLFSIPLTSAGNGVLTISRPGDDNEQDQPNAGQLWVGANDSTAKVIDLAHPFAVPLSISTGGTGRADELAYDSVNHIILIANDRDAKPFVTFISTKTHAVLGKIVYDGTLGNPQTTGGIEQPVFDANKKRFYIAIPSTTANVHGEVDEINPATRMITDIFPTTCSPAGLALLPGHTLMTSCGDIIDIGTERVRQHVAGVGGDEIWYNPGDARVYFGGGTDRISVNAVAGRFPWKFVKTLTVGQIFTTHPPPNQTTHSVAADSENNHIFVPVSNVGIKVYTSDEDGD